MRLASRRARPLLTALDLVGATFTESGSLSDGSLRVLSPKTARGARYA
jgi:hypothetical protein